jgi:D-lactate dehydrogenase
MLSGVYSDLYNSLSTTIPLSRLITDPLRTLVYGTDASLYRLIPRLVVKVQNEDEVIFILKKCNELRLPLTFRAAGTSLSGQAITDSVLLLLDNTWTNFQIFENAVKIKLQPGVIGAHANVYLAPYDKKIGPDPASINSAMIGGIAANNASGMCCGTAENSYKTLAGMRIVFSDGSSVDTNDPSSRARFLETHSGLIERLNELAGRVKSNEALAARIRHKYKMKNTTGYSLNALVDFDDPIEIIQHLMIGSEGTLGFISEITYHTVPEHPCKASALLYFPDIRTACKAVVVLKKQNVSAVELMDRAALRSVEHKQGMPPILKELDEPVAVLLVETRAESKDDLTRNIDAVRSSLAHISMVRPIEFTDIPDEYTKLWNIRKGLFPALGIMRKIGTTVIIEDVAFPMDSLADATLGLQALFRKHGYDEAIIFGHALEGNLHFVFNQDFNSKGEIVRYQYFIDDVTNMVVHTYDGALKAEHGTGRNMAPFVEMEWGADAYGLMKEIKEIFDPYHILNPGVILNDDPNIHLKNLKPMPAAHALIDKCIECGFCEINCPSRDLTLTPRQRIVAWREIVRLNRTGEDPQLLTELKRIFRYQGEQTCAVDGMCATSCPVDIDTGKLIKVLRSEAHSPTTDTIASFIADHMGGTVDVMRFGLNVVDAIHGLLGTGAMTKLSNAIRRLSGNTLPKWNPYMPKGSEALPRNGPGSGTKPKVVFVPSCVSRLMGKSRGSEVASGQIPVIDSVLRKAGFEVIYPENLKNLCCGMAFASKGYTKQGDEKSREMEQALIAASDNGEYPILMDTSPCTQRMQETFTSGIHIYEPAAFTLEFLVDVLTFNKIDSTIAVHISCSSRKMGLDAQLKQLAELCAERVVIPPFVGCCGFAGDRGFSYPELTLSALHNLRESLPDDISEGFSTSRGCEIGLSMQSKIHYKSIMYLVDACTISKSDIRKLHIITTTGEVIKETIKLHRSI